MTGEYSCRQVRHLLGVYVVGAIEPAERDVVDEHLTGCAPCRDELVSLAGLPALLSRVPATDVARLGQQPAGQAAPSAEVLGSLMRRAAGLRRARRWRAVAAAAAAAALTAGAAVAVNDAASHKSALAVVTGTSAATGISAVVDYSPTAWGTAMRVRVTGISPGTFCRFWILRGKARSLAGSWTVAPGGYGPGPWYPASATVGTGSVTGFEITADGRPLVTIPVR